MEIKAAIDNTLYSIAQGPLLVIYPDTDDVCRKVKLPVILVPGLKSVLIVATTRNGVKTVITTEGSILDLGLFSVQLSRSDNIDNLDLANKRKRGLED